MTNKNFERSKLTSIEKLEEIFKKIEDKTKLSRKNMVILYISSFILIWFGVFDIYISYLLTIYYQAIWSIKVISKKELDGDKQWLTYWIIFSIFAILDMFSVYIIKLIPFYFLIRTAILIWLSVPGMKGAVGVYNLAFVQAIKMSQALRNLEETKKDRLKNEIEEAIERTDEGIKDGEREILFPNFEINENKKNN